jgi:endo-1,4-beta-xylanase
MKITSAGVMLISLGLAITACSASSDTSSQSDTGGTAAWGAGTGGAAGQSPGGNPAGGTTVTGGGSGGTVSPSGGSPTGATGGSVTEQGGSTGGSPTTGGQPASGGSTVGSGGTGATGGLTSGGTTGSGGAVGPGGSTGSGGIAVGGNESGGAAAGGDTASGGAGEGGDTATGGAAGGGEETVDCSTPMPTGGETHTGASVYGTINGLNYGIWTNGSGGSITVFPDAHAFSASWDNSQNFLAHLGLDFHGSNAKPYSEYGTIIAQFVEQKYGDAGGFSMIGMYGWMHNPCIEWYIDEDSFHGLYGRGDVTATIDGAMYYLSTTTTTGTGGANACESGHTGPWTQIHSKRETARQCGTVTVSDHFKAWEAQGWTLGNLTSVHINVEVGGGVGSIDFPVANVTTGN